MFILNRLVEFHDKLINGDQTILSLLGTMMRHHGVDEELDVDTLAATTEEYIMDTLTDILQTHYDSRWIISNLSSDDLVQRLSKQKEREKQTLIQKLDTMSDEKRSSTVELQKMGVTNWHKTSEMDNELRVLDEYTNSPDNERYVSVNEILSQSEVIDSAMHSITGELESSSDYNPFHLAQEESGYNENDVDEGGEPEDDLHDYMDEETLDNEFN